ncbi:MAG: Na/Pi cotransporter family protein [Planctomycetota bacterium]
MNGTMVLLDAGGYVALLLWGMHMVQSGVSRAYGADLRRLLGSALKLSNARVSRGAWGHHHSASSTAVALIASSFAASGVVDLVPAFAIMLGAPTSAPPSSFRHFPSTSAGSPPFSFSSDYSHSTRRIERGRDLGRVAIGLGLMLHSLNLLIDTIQPLESSPTVKVLFQTITMEPTVGVLVSAAITWVSHSSVAIVLLVMSFVQANVIRPEQALVLVLGANLGSAINPVFEGVKGDNPANRRLPVGNLVNRAVGCLLFLPLLPYMAGFLARLDSDPTREVANFHTLFNVVMATLFIFPLRSFVRLISWLLPDRAKATEPGTPQYLDDAALDTPYVALANAAREALRMADVVEQMLRNLIDVFANNDRKLITATARMDDTLDKLHDAIKLYLSKISPETLNEETSRRYSDILTFTINLEHIGDIIDKNLLELAAKKIKHRLNFSVEGRADIRLMLTRLLDNLRLALAVFMTSDAAAARRLISEKETFRDMERAATESHFERLREGRLESIETSALHIDILRDAKRINSHITATAYPILDQAGVLRRSRLRDEPHN